MSSIRKYQPLVTIALLHDYYRELVSQDFVLKPSPATLKQLENYGLLVKSNELGKVQILLEKSGTTRDNLTITRSITRSVKLTFWLILQNPYFPNITRLERTEAGEPNDIPPISSGSKSIYYFSNLDPVSRAIQGISSGQAFLSRWDRVRTYDRIPLIAPLFNTSADKLAIFQPEANNPALQPVLEIEKKPEEKIIPIDLRGLTPGWYTVQATQSGVSTSTIGYLDPVLFKEDVFGVIDLYLDATLDFEKNLHYAIQFERRQSKWRYIVIDRNGLFDDSLTELIKYKATTGGAFPENVKFIPLSDIGISEQAQQAYHPADLYALEADSELPSLEENQVTLDLQLKEAKTRTLPLLSKQSAEPKIFIHL